MSSKQLKANFAVQNKHGAFFTGGKVKFSKDGEFMFCQCGNTVKVLNVKTGQQTSVIGQEEDDEVTCFGLSPDDSYLVVASRGLLLKKWDWKENVVVRTWKAIHTGPVMSMAFDVTSTLLATGGADSTIKVWDIIKQYCTHNLTGHSGVISAVAYHPDISRLQLFSAADDYKIRVWDLQTSSCKAVLDGHYSVITALQFSNDGHVLYSGGRDNVVIIWNTTDFTKTKTIPVYDSVEALVVLPEEADYSALNVKPDSPHFITGGAKGVLRVWNVDTCRCVYPEIKEKSEEESEEKSESSQAIISASYHQQLNTVNVVTYDHIIYMRNLPDLSINKQFVGYNDDVLDMAFLGVEDSHLVVATNSELVKVFQVSTMSCHILTGHTDIVLGVAVSADRNLFATGSKDNTIRVWQMDPEDFVIHCVAVANGHTHAVNSVSFPRLKDSFLVSGSHDCTLKTWELPEKFEKGKIKSLSSIATEHAHEKEINSVCVTPNDKLLASGSQDKTAKLWSSKTLSLLGVFRGHKRSIWHLQFSPVDQVLATASADATIKIWALSDFSCVKTFEGHQSSVLRLNFIARGMQLVSSGSDGLLKLWTIKSNECIGTWDEHDEKVWALAVTKDELNLATGAGDSTICFWKDMTEEEQLESIRKQEEFILQEQRLTNLLMEKKFLKALTLALTLNQPFRVLNIMREVLDGETGREDASATLQKLRDDQMDVLLGFCAVWNTNSKNCHVAQYIIQDALTNYTPERLMKLPNIKSTIEALLPYTERHFQRMNRLQQQSTFVDYTWQCMKPSTQPLGSGSEPSLVSKTADMEVSDDNDNDSSDNGSSEDENGKSTVTKSKQKPKSLPAKPQRDMDSEGSSDESEAQTKSSEGEESSSDSEEAGPTPRQSLNKVTPSKAGRGTAVQGSTDSEEESDEEPEQSKTIIRKLQGKKSTAKVLTSPPVSDKENDHSSRSKHEKIRKSEDVLPGYPTKKTPVKGKQKVIKAAKKTPTSTSATGNKRKTPKITPTSTKRRKP